MGIFYKYSTEDMLVESMNYELEMMSVVTEKAGFIQHIKNFFKKLADWFKNLFKSESKKTEERIDAKNEKRKESFEKYIAERDKELAHTQSVDKLESLIRDTERTINTYKNRLSRLTLIPPQDVKVKVNIVHIGEAETLVKDGLADFLSLHQDFISDLATANDRSHRIELRDEFDEKFMRILENIDTDVKDLLEQKSIHVSAETYHDFLKKINEITPQPVDIDIMLDEIRRTGDKHVDILSRSVVKLNGVLQESEIGYNMKLIQSNLGKLARYLNMIKTICQESGIDHDDKYQSGIFSNFKNDLVKYESNLKIQKEVTFKKEHEEKILDEAKQKLAHLKSNKPTVERYSAFGRFGG